MRSPALVAFGACLALSACINDNSRSTTGPGVVLPMFADHPVAQATPGPDDTPSVSGLSREGWSPIEVALAPDQVQSRPTYASASLPDSETARGRGDPVTARSALELGETQTWSQYGEAFSAPLYALGDFFMIPYRMYQSPPWSGTQTQPGGFYWRAPVGTDRGASASKAPKEDTK